MVFTICYIIFFFLIRFYNSDNFDFFRNKIKLFCVLQWVWSKCLADLFGDVELIAVLVVFIAFGDDVFYTFTI